MPYRDYTELTECKKLLDTIGMYTLQKYEFGAKGIVESINEIEQFLRISLDKLKMLPVDEQQKKNEPDGLDEIRMLRTKGPRILWKNFDKEIYLDKLEGALLSRFAGCTLGAAVEGWPVDRMEKWAEETGDSFPPTDYWSESNTALTERYLVNKFKDYTRSGIDGVPADDDVIYTLLGLMLLEKYGTDFTTENSAIMWMEYLHWVWVDMEIALNNYKRGVPALQMADDNPFNQMICADIRCDPFGYVVPGLPEKAAELAYKDSYASHRRNGLYGGMFFAASISAAFAVEHPLEAVEIGLTEIPVECELAKSIKWALKIGKDIKDYRQAREAVDDRFKGMVVPHTINNACLTIFGLILGGTDVTKVLSTTVAMGMDNDCSTATAGSIVGAVVGKKNIPVHWYKNFNNKIHSYIKNHRYFYIDDVVARYTKQAEIAFNRYYLDYTSEKS